MTEEQRIAITDRFWMKVDRREAHECWLWLACVTNEYGRFHVPADGLHYAHRVAYELSTGPIPEGLRIDHLCRVKLCVNPAHLEPVTQRENVLRGVSHIADNARKTHCKRGHPLSGSNLRIRSNGNRQCVACSGMRSTESVRRLRKRRREALIQNGAPNA